MSLLSGEYEILPTQQGYDRWAEIYDGEDNPLIALEGPEVQRLLGDVVGKQVADVGCGTGRQAVLLARQGATVTALDFSEGMLSRGREKARDLPIDWIAHDLQKRFPLANGKFDRVVCCLVLEHITALTALFGEMKRICKPDGWIVVSAMHPAMMLRGITARFTDPQSGRETRPQSHPNQLSDYVMAAIHAGLTIEHLGEHLVTEEVAAQSPRAQKYLDWPMLFIMRLRPQPSR